MNSLHHWLRSNRTILVAALVFCAAYAGILWFKYTSPPEVPATVVQGEPVETFPVSPEPAVVVSKPKESQESASKLTETEPASEAVETKASKATVKWGSDNRGDVAEQLGDSVAVTEEPVVQKPALPEGDLAISGRVLDRSGSPVPGIQVTARATYLFEEGQRKPIPRGAGERRTTSASDGAYAFEGLANGEYQVSTVATPRHARALIQVRAGVDFADLVVTGQRDLRVHGLVANPAGEPLAQVVLRPAVHPTKEVSTNKEGRYSFEVKLLDTAAGLTVSARREGYEVQDARLNTSELGEDNVLELNIVMEPESDGVLALVSGTVKGPRGDPVSGQRIGFSSAKVRQNYRATTDAEGQFVIQNVEPGEDYMLSINAAAGFKDYFLRNIKVTRNGLTLNIELEAGETGTLSGQMVNLFGNPVPDFSLVLQTKETSYYNQRVFGDGAGNFEIENAPAGELRLRTKSTPYYTIEGIVLPAGGALNIPVVLDWGYDEIQGKVVNDDGNPVAVTNISLTWSHQASGMRSSSRRTTAADEQGNFRFTQLGPGSHRLSVNAAGYKPVSVNHDVALQGSEVVVKLEPKE